MQKTLAVVGAGTGGGDLVEAEPNNTPAFANNGVDLPFECTGVIGFAMDQDMTRIDVTAGQYIEADVFSRIGYFQTPLDPLLIVYASDGVTILTWNDDVSFPSNLNSRVTFIAPYTGTIYLAVRSAVLMGGPNFGYILAVWPITVPVFNPSNVEIEPNNLPSQADPIQLPGIKIGLIAAPGDVDFSWFTAPAGVTLVVDVHSRIYGSPLDAVVDLVDPHGRTIWVCDDMDGFDPRFNVVLPESGAYFLRVRDYNGAGGGNFVYILSASIQDGSASPALTQLKFKPNGLLKQVRGANFSPTGAVVEVSGIAVPSTPVPAYPTNRIKVKPAVAIPAGGWVTVLNPGGRRSNPLVQ